MIRISDASVEAAYPPIGRLISVNGLNVHATHDGVGDPPVILIHGANVNLRDWAFSLVDRLAVRNRVIAMDRPGFGHSQRCSGPWAPGRQAMQLRDAAAMLGVRRPIVVGHSWGAVVALAWALAYPEELSGIVSVSGATMPWGPAVDVLEGLGVIRASAGYYTTYLANRVDRGSVEAFVARAFRPQAVPDRYLDYVGAPLSMRPATIRANSEDLGLTHSALRAMSGRYGALRMPVEIVHGERDGLLAVRRHVSGFAQCLPNVRVHVADGVGHMAHHARPDLLQAAIANISRGV